MLAKDKLKFEQIKIIDFGLSKHFVKGSETKKMKTSIGTETYAAPEVFKGA